MCVCQGVINPGPSSIHYSKWGEEAKNTDTSCASLFPLLSVFISCFVFFFCPPCHKLSPVSTDCSLTPISFSPFFFFVFLLHTEALPFSRGAPTSLKLWWMALAPVLISKLKQFRDKTSRSLSYRFCELGLRWHLVSEWIREWKRRWMHTTS